MNITRREYLATAGVMGVAGCSSTIDDMVVEDEGTTSENKSTTKVIEPNSDAGFHYPYFLYKPGTRHDTELPIFVQTHNAPKVSTREELRSQVQERVNLYLRVARELNLPGLVPAFPRVPDDGGNMIQNLSLPSIGSTDRLQDFATAEFSKESLTRVDQQLIQMLKDAQRRLTDDGYTITDQIHMFGFSSSGQFASRFTFLYPQRVRSITVGGDGAHPLPKKSLNGITLPYPLGATDYQSLTGREFDITPWRNTHKYIFVGEDDQPLPETDQRSYYPISYEHEAKAVAVFGKNRVKDRLPLTKYVYDDMDAHASYHVYEDAGHEYTSEMQADVLNFHRKSLETPSTEPVKVTPDNVPSKPPDIPADPPDE